MLLILQSGHQVSLLGCGVNCLYKYSYITLSVRDPSQVFILLESLYCAFDTIANRMKVFKVETIGDCYVAGMTRNIVYLSLSSLK
jgi:Adenylate and Guanylate cyclase catalytic domain